MSRRQSRPVSYNSLRRRVMQHRTTDLLVAIATVNADLMAAEFGGSPALPLPNVVTPFGLAGVARTALVGGQDRYGKPVTLSDLVELCSLYGNVHDPAVSEQPGRTRLRSLMNHMAYEQFGHQFSAMENIGRTVVLLNDHAAATPNAPSADDWTDGLGVSLEHFIRIGFGMQVAAASNGGVISRDVLKLDHVAPMFTPATADEALAIVDRWFAATPEELRAAGAAEETRGAEKWALSPLVAKPIVALPDGRYVMPWSRLVIDRVTPTGLYFIGLELFGKGFPDALGVMFETYCGTMLGLLEHAEVRPEIVYGKPERKTVDHFVISPEAVVLVEEKSARPTRATRLGEPAGDDDTANKLGNAYDQIERTAQMIRDGHPAVASIPSDRPLIGLVVTLEPFHLVNTDLFYGDVLRKPSIPTTIASSHELEGAVASLRGAPDVGRRLLDALGTKGPGGARISDACDGLADAPNPLLDEAWERFSQPLSDLAAAIDP
jgi:hypothetical protein